MMALLERTIVDMTLRVEAELRNRAIGGEEYVTFVIYLHDNFIAVEEKFSKAQRAFKIACGSVYAMQKQLYPSCQDCESLMEPSQLKRYIVLHEDGEKVLELCKACADEYRTKGIGIQEAEA